MQSDNCTQRLQLYCPVSVLFYLSCNIESSGEGSAVLQIWLSFNYYRPTIKILIFSPKSLYLSLFPFPRWLRTFLSSKNCESYTVLFLFSFIDSLFSRQLSQPSLFLPSGLKFTENFLPFNWVFAAMIKPIIALSFLYSKISMLGTIFFFLIYFWYFCTVRKMLACSSALLPSHALTVLLKDSKMLHL